MISMLMAAGLNVLVLGESHMSLPGQLLDPLHADLTAQGAVVHSIGVCGASAGDWLKPKPADCSGEKLGGGAVVYKGRGSSTRPIKGVIAKDKTDLVVVVIGDTMASYDAATLPQILGVAERHQPDQGNQGQWCALCVGWSGMGQGGWQVQEDQPARGGNLALPRGQRCAL